MQLNRQYLHHDYYTDIITFDHQPEDSSVAGDLFISIDRVKDNAARYSASFMDELHRVIIHGVLHLCGYGDKSPEEEREMRQKENEALLSRPKGLLPS